MRISKLSILSILAATTSIASADRKERTLEPVEVEAHVKPYLTEIEKCYVGAAGEIRGAGKLELDLVIHRDGSVLSLKVATPGLAMRQSQRVETCVRTAVENVKFPMRRDFTTAIVPYFFQKTMAPNAGPIQSCWSPKGCWPNTNVGREQPEPVAIHKSEPIASR
ncbi:MAG TPA: hypothetical protein VGO00_23845 [Kofleriaceae bacterium]|nr:hypothetical protein [Kofleriaceae bacterium]